MRRVIISIDVEATGKSPATSSCVMIGAVAMLEGVDPDETEYVVSKRQWCIEEQEGKGRDKRCWEEFWLKNMPVWEYIQEHKRPPESIMAEFASWYAGLSRKYTGLQFVMKPASYDWQWINALYDKYGPADKPTLPFSNICLSTLIKATRDKTKMSGNVLNRLTKCPDFEHTHMADDDAHEQGYRYLKLRHLFYK
jgi:hypothetical protein